MYVVNNEFLSLLMVKKKSSDFLSLILLCCVHDVTITFCVSDSCILGFDFWNSMFLYCYVK